MPLPPQLTFLLGANIHGWIKPFRVWSERWLLLRHIPPTGPGARSTQPWDSLLGPQVRADVGLQQLLLVQLPTHALEPRSQSERRRPAVERHNTCVCVCVCVGGVVGIQQHAVEINFIVFSLLLINQLPSGSLSHLLPGAGGWSISCSSFPRCFSMSAIFWRQSLSCSLVEVTHTHRGTLTQQQQRYKEKGWEQIAEPALCRVRAVAIKTCLGDSNNDNKFQKTEMSGYLRTEWTKSKLNYVCLLSVGACTRTHTHRHTNTHK